MSGTRIYTGPSIACAIYGDPVPQGSMKSYGRGRMVHSNAAKLLPWREHVQIAVERAMAEKVMAAGTWPITGPVAVSAVFTVRKPASAPKRRRTYPDRKPDLDKLIRSVLDALTASGLIKDDAQVVELHKVQKVYPNETDDALASPGLNLAVMRVQTIERNP